MNSEEIKENIKNNLIELRKRHGLVQSDVVKALKIGDASTYRSWETGRSSPKAPMLVKIAESYGITVDMLLNDIDAPRAKTIPLLQSDHQYNKEIYGDKYLSELSNAEKIIIMQFRQLNSTDRENLTNYLEELLPE